MMGVDACIYFKTTDGGYPDLCDSLLQGADISAASEWAIEGATHEIDTPWRFYGPGYERGPWPKIAAVLMALHACKNVETVWYLGDHIDYASPFTPEQIVEYSLHYMKNGDRPYRDLFRNLTNL